MVKNREVTLAVCPLTSVLTLWHTHAAPCEKCNLKKEENPICLWHSPKVGLPTTQGDWVLALDASVLLTGLPLVVLCIGMAPTDPRV